MMMMMNTTVIHNHQSLSWTIGGSSVTNSSPFLLNFNNKNKNKKNKFQCCCVSASPSQSTTTSVVSLDKNQNKPSAGEVARTIMELSSIGTLSSITNNNLSCVGVRFAVDPENGSPIVSLNPSIHLHSNNNITSTINVQSNAEDCEPLNVLSMVPSTLPPPPIISMLSDARWVGTEPLGFDVHLYSPENDLFEVRIPFPREVTNEKGAKSAFNGMSQQAWEVEKNYHALEFQKAS
ncbi:glutamyl-tRNA reductase-binding protein, chloroplastic isoform X2 [Tanacetum coccineum]